MEQKKEIPQPLMVTIRCCTFNHEPYIRDCLEGFVMQKTNFRFEAIVHDDASTDGIAAIIKEYAEKYPDIIKPIFETENQYSKHDGSLGRIMNEHTHGKYVAYCEGDDYWIDQLKLQKQVDFLEAHPDYSMCCSNYSVCDANNKILRTFNRKQHEITIDNLLSANEIGTLTVVYRRALIEDYNPPYKGLKLGDYPLWFHLVMKGKCMCLPDVMASYRELPESASHSVDKRKLLLFEYDVLKIIDYYATLLNKKAQVNENVKERMTQVLNTCFHYGYIKLLPNAFYKLLKQYGGYDLRARAFRLALKTKVLYQLSKCLKKW